MNCLAKKKAPSSGLPYCPQPTPEWQKSVKSFFKITPRPKAENGHTSDTEENKENEEQSNRVSDDEVEEVEASKSSRSKGKGPASGKKS